MKSFDDYLIEFLEYLEKQSYSFKNGKTEDLKKKFKEKFNRIDKYLTATDTLYIRYADGGKQILIENAGLDLLRDLRQKKLIEKQTELIDKQTELVKHSQSTAKWTKWMAVGTIVMAIAMIITTFISIFSYSALIDKSPRLYVTSQFGDNNIIIGIANQVENAAMNIDTYLIISTFNLTKKLESRHKISLLNKDTKMINFSILPIDPIFEEYISKQLNQFEGYQVPFNFEIEVSCANCQKEDIVYINKKFNINIQCYKKIDQQLKCNIE